MSNSELKNNESYAYKCGGIPMFPDKSLYDEMCEKLNEEELEQYKLNVEKYFGDLKFDLPWNNE